VFARRPNSQVGQSACEARPIIGSVGPRVVRSSGLQKKRTCPRAVSDPARRAHWAGSRLDLLRDRPFGRVTFPLSPT
jgi:hypothetical protein